MANSVPPIAIATYDRNQDLGALITYTADGVGTVNSRMQDSGQGIGCQVVVNITAITGTGPSLTVNIQAFDVASGQWVTVLASAALGAVGTTRLVVYPGVAVTANVSASTVLSQFWRVQGVIAGTTPAVTATIGVCALIG